ncbi:TolC family protein [Candidatus Latescibacterota bacterium]
MKQKKQYKTKLQIVLMLFTGIFLCAQYSLAVELLSLDNAIETAMSNSPAIKRTELSLIQSTEFLNARKASLKSNFSLRLNPFSFDSDRRFNDYFSKWNTNETKRSSGTFTIAQPIVQTDGTLRLNNTLSWQNSFSEQGGRNKTFDNNLFVEYSQPIFTYNTTKMELSELELDIQNSQYNYALQKLSLEQGVTQSFYNVYQAKMTLDISEEELKNSEASYEIQKNKVEAGLLSSDELYQAELILANSQLSVLNNRISLENILDTFKIQLGISIYDSIDVFTDVTHKTIDVDIEKALNHGLRTRMELRQMENDIQEAINNLTVTAARNEFKGNVTLSYGIIGTDQDFGNVYENPTNKQGVGLSFDIPLWDWGESAARMKAAEAGVDRTELSLEDLRNDIILNIRSAHRNLENLVIQIDIARQSVRNAQLTYDINLERYRNGDLTSMDLSLIQEQLSSANQGEVRSLIDYKMALLNLKILSLWDFENNVSVLPEDINLE